MSFSGKNPFTTYIAIRATMNAMIGTTTHTQSLRSVSDPNLGKKFEAPTVANNHEARFNPLRIWCFTIPSIQSFCVYVNTQAPPNTVRNLLQPNSFEHERERGLPRVDECQNHPRMVLMKSVLAGHLELHLVVGHVEHLNGLAVDLLVLYSRNGMVYRLLAPLLTQGNI